MLKSANKLFLTTDEEELKKEMRDTAMETYKLVTIIVKPFLDSQLWRSGIRKKLRLLEKLTQEVIQEKK